MKRFNLEDGVLDFDSLLCNIVPVGSNPQVPGDIPLGEGSSVPGAGKVQSEGENKIPPAGDKEVAGEKKTPLEEPRNNINSQNTKETLEQLDKVQTSVVSITELLQAIIKMNRDRKDMEMKMLWTECENVCNNIQSQADNIRKDAVKNLVVGLACSAVSVVCGTMSIVASSKGLKEMSAAKTELNNALSVENLTEEGKKQAYKAFEAVKGGVDSRIQFWKAVGDVTNSVSQMGNSISDYFSKQMEADNKKLDAVNEVLRTAMEEIKKATDDARNSITSCQSNISELLQTNRQTLNKVMG